VVSDEGQRASAIRQTTNRHPTKACTSPRSLGAKRYHQARKQSPTQLDRRRDSHFGEAHRQATVMVYTIRAKPGHTPDEAECPAIDHDSDDTRTDDGISSYNIGFRALPRSQEKLISIITAITSTNTTLRRSPSVVSTLWPGFASTLAVPALMTRPAGRVPTCAQVSSSQMPKRHARRPVARLLLGH
jgi:hypothetical protein